MKQWKSDGALAALVDWLRTEGNYSRWRGGVKATGATKETVCAEICALIKSRTGNVRSPSCVRNKILNIEVTFRVVRDWLGNTGAGVLQPRVDHGGRRCQQEDHARTQDAA